MLPRYPTTQRATCLPSDASTRLWQTAFYYIVTHFIIVHVSLQSWNTDVGEENPIVLMATIRDEVRLNNTYVILHTNNLYKTG